MTIIVRQGVTSFTIEGEDGDPYVLHSGEEVPTWAEPQCQNSRYFDLTGDGLPAFPDPAIDFAILEDEEY